MLEILKGTIKTLTAVSTDIAVWLVTIFGYVNCMTYRNTIEEMCEEYSVLTKLYPGYTIYYDLYDMCGSVMNVLIALALIALLHFVCEIAKTIMNS